MTTWTRAAAMVPLVLVALVGCSSGDDQAVPEPTASTAAPLEPCEAAGAKAAAGEEFDLEACPTVSQFRTAYNAAADERATREDLVELLAPLCRGIDTPLCASVDRVLNPPTTAPNETRPTTTTTTTTLPGPEGAYLASLTVGARKGRSDGLLLLLGNEMCDRWRNPDGRRSPHEALRDDLETSSDSGLVEPAATHLCPDLAPVLADVQAGHVPPLPPPEVVFEVTGGPTRVSITFTAPGGTSQEQDVPTPLERRFPLEGFGDFYYVSAQITDPGYTGSITCRITVDGEVVAEVSATGFPSIAQCDA